jgi:hypothetical protein
MNLALQDTNDANEEKAIDLMVEQKEIIDCVDNIRKQLRGQGLAWNRFRGYAISSIVAHYLQQRLLQNVKVAKLAWIEGCPTEFDLLIVDKNAIPFDFTNAFPKEKVRLTLEVKGSGVFYKRGDVKRCLSDLFRKWELQTGRTAVYLSIWEAKAHVQEVREALGNDRSFILEIEGQDITWREWERFLNEINAIVQYSAKPV